MKLERLSLQPKQYYTLEEPLKIYLYKGVTQSQLEIMLDAFARRKTPLVISGKANKAKDRFGEWTYQIQMPTFTLNMCEGNVGKVNFSTTRFQSWGGENKSYHNRFMQMFFIEANQGIYLIFKNETYYVHPGNDWEKLSQEDNPDWEMSAEVFDDLVDRMRSYFTQEAEYERSQRVSDSMRENVLDHFDRYTEKEHELETQQIDFTKGVPYHGWTVCSKSTGKKSSFALISNDPSADPEVNHFTTGQQLAIYGEDQRYCGLSGLLVEIDTAAEEGVRFVLEFYQQFNLSQLPKSGRLFIHQNDTQYKIRKNVAKSIYRGKTRAKYMYKTFRDYSVEGYEDLQQHPDLVPFLHERMGKQFPPNQMQLEAIVKGLLTKDMLLVLGPPGTGKTTVILSWVEYFLSQRKRVLISSQNNSAVDNVLERLGEDPNREIVRLGREEKVQENCKQFIPDFRIGSMRESCERNSQRLKSQLQAELEQIEIYQNAMAKMRDLLNDQQQLSGRLQPMLVRMASLSDEIGTSNTQRGELHHALSTALVQRQRYRIYLEESDRKGFLERLLKFGKRRHAKQEFQRFDRDIKTLEPKLRDAERRYNRSCLDLQANLQQLRSDNLLQQHQQLRQDIRQQQDLILGVGADPSLVPVFESELQVLDCLADYRMPTRDELIDLQYLNGQDQMMEQVKNAAVKVAAASDAWVRAALSGDRNEVFDDILIESCQVVGATCIGINSNKRFASVDFDVTIIDESGQIQLHNALVPMSRSPKTLMLGDYKQIPPIVNDEIMATCQMEGIATELYEQSFFEFLFEKMRRREIDWLTSNPRQMLGDRELPADPGQAEQLCSELAREEILKPRAPSYIGKPRKSVVVDADGTEKTIYQSSYSQEQVEDFVGEIIRDRKKIVNLNSQFRMPGHISDVISEWFYESNYFSSYDMSRFSPVVPGTTLPMVIIDTSRMKNRFESRPANNMGYQNTAEAEIVADVLESILQRMSKEDQLKYVQSLDKRLGVISAYGAQVRHIRQTLCKRLQIRPSEASTAVASLDSFQGQERDLIIYSLTRSDRKPADKARVGFLKELRRLNVAFTRCKKQLVIIGDLDYLQSCMFMQLEDDQTAPCAQTSDSQITKLHVNQCAECSAVCERRFSRFFRLLMQHVRAEQPAGDLIPGEHLKQFLKGGQ